MTTQETVQTLAESTHKLFVKDTRTSNGEEFWKTTDDAPEWVKEMCREAHGEMMPDDWRYAFIVEALDALAESEDPDEASVESDIYTHELTGWLHSRADRYDYCDEAYKERGGHFTNTVELLMIGQALEKAEVLVSVRASLEAQLETVADEA
jgi:hypothetical protein